MRLADVRSYCLDVAHFNMMVSSVKNKSNVLFMAAARLIQHVLQAFPDESIHVLVDRHGGRVHYREHLMRCFPEMDLRIVCEQRGRSAYEMRGPRRLLRVSFEVGADAQRLPVALASMISKYIRELLMGCLNRYFMSMAEGIKPTAGYWEDGLRFVDDLRTRLPHVSLDSERLVRCR
jgi:ribonuclease HIII